MPCDSVAVAKATLDSSIQAEILGKPGVVMALRNWLAQTYSAQVTEYYSTPQELSLSVVAKSNGESFGLTIDTYTGTARIMLRPMMASGEAYTKGQMPQIQQFLTALAKYATRERTIATVKAKFRVVNDVLMPGAAGPARVLTLEV